MGAEDVKIDMDLTKEGLDRFKINKKLTNTFTPCRYTDNGPCYYDGSGLHAEEVLKMLIEKGGEAVWQHMEECYHEKFDEVEETVQ